jgi:hypothetical protein
LAANTEGYWIICEEDAKLSTDYMGGNKGIVVGKRLEVKNPIVVRTESFVGDEVKGPWTFTDGLKTNGDGYRLSDFVDFNLLESLAQKATPLSKDGFRVIVIENDGEFTPQELGVNKFDNGNTLIVFQTDKTVKLGGKGMSWGCSILAPFAKVELKDFKYISGYLVARKVDDRRNEDDGGAMLGFSYNGPFNCYKYGAY